METKSNSQFVCPHFRSDSSSPWHFVIPRNERKKNLLRSNIVMPNGEKRNIPFANYAVSYIFFMFQLVAEVARVYATRFFFHLPFAHTDSCEDVKRELHKQEPRIYNGNRSLAFLFHHHFVHQWQLLLVWLAAWPLHLKNRYETASLRVFIFILLFPYLNTHSSQISEKYGCVFD